MLLFITTSDVHANFPQTPKTTGHFCTIKDRDFSRFRYDEQIPYCYRNVRYELKTKKYKEYKVDLNTRDQYTIDHIIPLSIGGSNHPQNLWPQHKSIITAPYEREVYEMVRDSKIKRKVAVQMLMLKKFDPDKSWAEIKREVLGF